MFVVFFLSTKINVCTWHIPLLIINNKYLLRMVDGNVYENGVKNISCPPQAIDSLWLVECLACVRLALLLEWNAHVNRFEAVVFRNGDTYCGLHFVQINVTVAYNIYDNYVKFPNILFRKLVVHLCFLFFSDRFEYAWAFDSMRSPWIWKLTWKQKKNRN